MEVVTTSPWPGGTVCRFRRKESLHLEEFLPPLREASYFFASRFVRPIKTAMGVTKDSMFVVKFSIGSQLEL